MAELEDKIAVVTGAGARSDRALGIGETTAIRFADAGATVVAVDVDGELAERTVQLIEENGGEAVAVETDLTDGEAVAALGDAVEERFGRLDVLVNNAGIRIEGGPLTDVDTAAIERIVDVNLTGVMRACKHLVPLMANTGGGAIVNISSANAEVGRSGWGPYDASKAGLLALTRDMAADHAADDIRVNAVSPGWTITDYHLPADDEEAEPIIQEWSSRRSDGPGILKRNAMPEEQAEAVLFLASERASYITGTNLHVDGGLDVVGHGHDIE
ncbi:SDR family NAD(P)-dependent oxidoreductase [Haloprofundus halobius]|uniref:SDR family NAD(P)-dependent oxidoreductase n=1 Tax=Haloprofundus halobius TaxID=2876194 RepID=UPI001CCC74FD|nr:SDR family oxidoreductase [Haloprofundus halobius]